MPPPVPDNAGPKRPTFEKRLEAIWRTLRLAAAMRLDDDREFRQRFGEIGATLQEIAANHKRGGERIVALVRIAEVHDRRLTHLEGDQQQ